MLKILTIVFSISLLALASCVKPQTENTALNNSSNGGSSGAVAANNSNNRAAEINSASNKANAKTFLGDLSDKRVEINLTRDSSNLSGIYKYEKVGKDLKLAGTIDASGNFTLQETDAAGGKTGEWKGVWKESGGRAALNGKWKNPKGGDELNFSADELKTEFTGGAKITTKTFSEENKEKFWEINAEYPELSGVDSAATFNQAVKKIVDGNVSEFKKDLPDYTSPDDLKRYKESEIKLYDQTTYELQMANDDLISVIFTDASFGGGAHGSAITTTLNFDVKTNRVLKLADIFEPNSNYLKLISDISRADLKAKLQKDEMFDEEMFNPGSEAKAENYGAWNLTKNGLLITFDAYQVAAYAAGPQEVLIPYSKLQNILKKDGVIAKLAK